jgi:hypothetical protein
MQEEKFSAQESLQLISDTINKVKGSYHDRGIGPILWGCVVTFCSLVSVYAGLNKINWLYNVWFLTIVAVLPQILISIKERKEKKFVSFNDVATNVIWTTFGFSMFTMSFIDNMLRFNYHFYTHGAIYMLIYGIPTIITGGICKIKPMLWGGILCWVFAIISTFFNHPYTFFFTAASAVVAWLIPGLIMNAHYRKHKAANV